MLFLRSRRRRRILKSLMTSQNRKPHMKSLRRMAPNLPASSPVASDHFLGDIWVNY